MKNIKYPKEKTNINLGEHMLVKCETDQTIENKDDNDHSLFVEYKFDFNSLNFTNNEFDIFTKEALPIIRLIDGACKLELNEIAEKILNNRKKGKQ